MNCSYRRNAVRLFAMCTLLVAVGCGGQKTAPASTPTAMSEIQREQAALPLTQVAPVPKSLRCRGEIVWVNLHTKAYHEPADPYYGRTKMGQYMCKAAADAAGYRVAGTAHPHAHRVPAMTTETPAPEPT